MIVAGPRFEWDAERARANLRKHEIDLADAVVVFEDERGLTRRAMPSERRQENLEDTLRRVVREEVQRMGPKRK